MRRERSDRGRVRRKRDGRSGRGWGSDRGGHSQSGRESRERGERVGRSERR